TGEASDAEMLSISTAGPRHSSWSSCPRSRCRFRAAGVCRTPCSPLQPGSSRDPRTPPAVCPQFPMRGADEKSWALPAGSDSVRGTGRRPMRYAIRLTIVAATLSLGSAGCVATEQWTQDLVGKRQAEMDTRVTTVETEVREHGERLDKVEG